MRTVVLGLVALILAAGCGGGDDRAQDPPDAIRYVALGDSIGRGAAIRGPLPGKHNEVCEGTNALIYNFSRWDTPRFAYPRLIEAKVESETGRPVALLDFACSGLSAKDLANPRIHLLRDAIAAHPDVVTVLIGANDVVVQCLPKRLQGLIEKLNPFASKQQALELYAKCSPQRIANGLADVRAGLPAILKRLEDETDAEVFVGTYYSATGVEAENRVAGEINGAIRAATEERGDRFHLVTGIEEDFRRHDCRASKAETWLLGWDLCLHPNKAGHRAIADRFFGVIKPFADEL